jgi:hypothetical protein
MIRAYIRNQEIADKEDQSRTSSGVGALLLYSVSPCHLEDQEPVVAAGELVGEHRGRAFPRRRSMSDRNCARYSALARLIEHPDRCFAGHNAWNAHLEALGVSALKVNPDP